MQWIQDPDPQHHCPLFSLAQSKEMRTKENRLKFTVQYGMSLWSLHPTAVQMLLVDYVLDPNATSTPLCSGSVTCWYGPGFGYGSSDPYLRLMNPAPDPSLSVGDIQVANKIFFSKFLCLFHSEGTFTLYF
jgi:hypothetical protein